MLVKGEKYAINLKAKIGNDWKYQPFVTCVWNGSDFEPTEKVDVVNPAIKPGEPLNDRAIITGISKLS